MKARNSLDYRLPARETRAEIEVTRSRFIACAAPASSVEEARDYIQRIRKEFAGASHHVPAFRIGFGASVVEHCADDREPAGTAGKPVLAVIQGSQIGDIVVVVVRYFGGTKLGSGGLVRAYRDAARAVMAQLPLARRQPVWEILTTIPYACYQKTCALVDACQGTIVEETFADKVTLAVRLPSEAAGLLHASLTDLTLGKCDWQITRQDVSVIVPLPPQS